MGKNKNVCYLFIRVPSFSLIEIEQKQIRLHSSEREEGKKRTKIAGSPEQEQEGKNIS
jgi:hypothetical protein